MRLTDQVAAFPYAETAAGPILRDKTPIAS